MRATRPGVSHTRTVQSGCAARTGVAITTAKYEIRRRYLDEAILRCSSKNARTCSGSSVARNSTATGSGSGENTLSGVGIFVGFASMILSSGDINNFDCVRMRPFYADRILANPILLTLLMRYRMLAAST